MLWYVILTVAGGLLVWHYAGYPAILSVFVSGASERSVTFEQANLPSVTIIIIAYNEAESIEERLENCLHIDYPIEKIEIIVASDGSTDNTVELARSVDGPITVFNNSNGSKAETRNIAVKRATHDIICFTDADTRYEPACVRQLVNHYADPDVGAVCGTLVSESFEEGAIGQGMNVYWKWEYRMRELQGRLGKLVKMSGANMSVRKSFYHSVPDEMDIDQVAALDVLQQGGKTRHARDAVAVERFPTSPHEEYLTRRRLTIRALTALEYHSWVFNPLKNPLLAIHTASYWALRYAIPFLLISVLGATVAIGMSSVVILTAIFAQALFYSTAILGYIFPFSRSFAPISIAFSYCWANMGIAQGVLAYLAGNRLESY